ncbi:MAG: hypothetical protein QNJ91_10100 [Gammaproteobacteria bacterium]|nr:hypothetical protein [Gammaproteobacteria bacterium]
MHSKFLTAAAATGLLLAAQATVAGGSFISGAADEKGYDWSAEALYEPCMNGEVSAKGQFRSQLAEDKAMARMTLTTGVE